MATMEEKAKQIAELLKALANENRLLILCALMQGPMTVSALAAQAPHITQSALSQHLGLLKAHGMVDSQKSGQSVTYAIADRRVAAVIEALKRHYCDSDIKAKADKTMVEVVAALIWDGDKFMICRRPAHKARPLLWEFPGGKVEPGEGREQALIRECQEELAITLAVGDMFMQLTHEYPDLSMRLILFHAAIIAGSPQKLEHEDIRWIRRQEIAGYEFCPADRLILEALAAPGR